MKIDLEPTWLEIWNMVKSGHLKPEFSDLDKACNIADIIRQAQKNGRKSITFSFEDGGKVSYDDGVEND